LLYNFSNSLLQLNDLASRLYPFALCRAFSKFYLDPHASHQEEKPTALGNHVGGILGMWN
jgi:hypothetical protein